MEEDNTETKKQIVKKKLVKHSLGFYKKLVNNNINIIPIINTPTRHMPKVKWTKYEKEKIAEGLIEKWHANTDVVSFGLVTGYNDIFAVDIDSKILPTKKAKDEFIKEYFELLENHIDDFYNKVCVVQSQSGGYHILYKTKGAKQSGDIASPKDYESQLIESKGDGGFVYIYKRIKGLEYHEIDYISEEDSTLIIQISQTYDYKEPVIPKKLKRKQTINQDGLTPWEDYANKNDVWSVVSSDFDIVRHGTKSNWIRRKGADSYMSGHIFDDSGKMYLFSTGTIYPNEKPLNSFDCYAIKYFNGDYSAASKQAYFDGYGDRYERQEIHTDPIIKSDDIVFPLDILPEFYQNYILECNNKLNSSIDFMGSAFLWMMSLMIGNTMKIEVAKGWTDNCSIWLSLIGDAGVGKTPDIKLIIKPMKDLNEMEIEKYAKKRKAFKEYEKLSKEEKKTIETMQEPLKSQMIVDDITIESLIDIHSYNPKSIGVFKDELAGWFKDQNKYREGSDTERFLSSWSGDSIVLNRKTAEDAFVKMPFIPILGGIQPSIFKQFQTEENAANGFMDRMLFCNPNKQAEYLSTDELTDELISSYRDSIFQLNNKIDKDYLNVTDNQISSKILRLTKDAKILQLKYDCELVDLQNSDNEIHYYKGMFAKQRTYTPRFSLIIEALSCLTNNIKAENISVDSYNKAILLSKYFINQAKINKQENIINGKLKDVHDSILNKPNKEIALELVKKFPNETKKKIAGIMNISVRTLSRHIK